MESRKYLIGPGALDCNRGDQALVWQAIDIIRKVDKGAEIAIMTDNYDDPDDPQTRQTKQKGVQVLPAILPNPRRAASKGKVEVHDSGFSLIKMKVRALLDFFQMQILLIFSNNPVLARFMLGRERYETYKYIKECKALIIKGGGYIYAHPGVRWLYYMWFGLFPLIIAQKLGVKTIVLPNSFGPFENQKATLLAQKVLGACDLVTAREPQSLAKLNELMPGKAKLFPDMAFNLDMADRSWAEKELESKGVPYNEKTVGLTMRPWRFPDVENPEQKYQDYISSLNKFVQYLINQGYKVILFAHVIGPHAHEDDRIALKDLMDTFGDNSNLFYIDGDYDCYQIKSFYGLMDYMICTRFHSAIFSLSQNIPCIAISYQGYKATGIMADLELEEYAVGINDVNYDLLVTMFNKIENDRELVINKLKASELVIRNKFAELNCIIKEIIQK